MLYRSSVLWKRCCTHFCRKNLVKLVVCVVGFSYVGVGLDGMRGNSGSQTGGGGAAFDLAGGGGPKISVKKSIF